MPDDTPILISYAGKIATLTLNVPKKLNALNADLYYQLARAMHEVAAHDEVYITILTGTGRFFSAYVYFELHPSPTPISI
jgi:peroxisomal 3,2-trans-enoyl-CoA isomerase